MGFRILVQQCVTAALGVIGFALISAPVVSAYAIDGVRVIAYAGNAPQDPDAIVEFDLKRRDGANYRADWRIDQMTMGCNDGSTIEENVGLDVRFYDRRLTFHVIDSDVNPQSSDEYILEVKGRLLDGGTARGFVSYVVDREDPPVTGFPDQPDCASEEKLRWRAARLSPPT